MARSSHSQDFRQQFAVRLTDLVEQHLRLSLSEVSRRIGYANTSTMHKAARAAGCLDVERLAALAQMRTPDGRHPNLHWLLSGTGQPTVDGTEPHSHVQPLDSLRREVVDRVRRLDRDKVEAMLALLGT